jgi:chromosome segregation ATPase
VPIETTSPAEDLIILRVTVARMEGMLTQALTDQSVRMTKAETEISALRDGLSTVHNRLGEKGKMLATHTERIQSNHDRIEDLEDRQQAAMPRTVAVIGPVVAAAALLLTLAQMIPWTSL